MTQGQQNNNFIEEYDLSILDEVNNKEFNLGEALKETMFYLLPIFSFLFFLSILFFAVIPSISSINDKMTKIGEMQKETDSLNLRIDKINALAKDAKANQTEINKINFIVPTGQTEVVKFGERIKSTLNQFNIFNTQIKSGESSVVAQNATQNSAPVSNSGQIIALTTDENILSIREIPSKFDVKGQ